MKLPRPRLQVVRGAHRAWQIVDAPSRRRLRLISIYGVAIAGLDTMALLLVYGLIALMGNQKLSGAAGWAVHSLGLQSSTRYHTALVLLGITASLFVVRSMLSILGLWLMAGTANTAQADIVSRLLVGYTTAPQLLRLGRNSAQSMRTVLQAANQVAFGVVSSSASLLANTAVGVAVGLGLFLSSPFVALTITLYFILVAWLWLRLVRGPLVRRGTELQSLYAEQYRLIMQGLSAAKELQLRGRARFYATEAVNTTRRLNAAMRFVGVTGGALRYVLETSLVLGTVLVVAASALTGGRDAVLPAIGLVLAGAFRLLPALNQILSLANSVQTNSPAIDIVENDLQAFGTFSELPVEPDVEPYRLERDVRLEHVSFSYPGRTEPALHDVSFEVLRGQSCGIIGPTGSGKSTLLDVILGLLEPESGRVCIDGVPMSERRQAWQRSIGYVPQDVYLVDDTLRANVALGWRGDAIDETAVEEAIELAGLAEVVAELPEGLDTVVGERGARLSGGQRQRVGIARALYTRPTVLVLDEATSSLDQATERRIVDSLAILPRGMTMIIVTHRMQAIRHCDNVICLEQGAVRTTGRLADIERELDASAS